MNVTGSPARLTACLALCALIAGCGEPDQATPAPEQPPTTRSALTTTPSAVGEPREQPARSAREQSFLQDLADHGIPTATSPDTAIEVGYGICHGLDEGNDPGRVLERIRPFTSALAAHTGGQDTAAVGRAVVDASRTHLCD